MFAVVGLSLLLGTGVLGQQLVSRDSVGETARSGQAFAENQLGIESALVLGPGKTIRDARKWFEKSAGQGYAPAQVNLAVLYCAVGKLAEAAMHFRFAAEHGETGAMVDLGFLNDSGLGMAVDKTEAAKWYRLAAERGDALGQNNLADLYLRGEGLAQSDASAKEWFEKAADQGNTGARI